MFPATLTLRTLLRLIFVVIGILTTARLAFSIYFYELIGAIPDVFYILVQGFRIDLIVVGYFFLIPALFTVWLKEGILSRVLKDLVTIWLVASFAAIILLEVITPQFIQEYRIRPNYIFLGYLAHPKETFVMLWQNSKLMIVISFITLLASIAFCFYLLKTNKIAKNNTSLSSKIGLTFVIIFLGFSAIRSSVQAKPFNPSMVYFSNNNLVNSLLLNSSFSVLFALNNTYKISGTFDLPKKAPKPYMTEAMNDMTAMNLQRTIDLKCIGSTNCHSGTKVAFVGDTGDGDNFQQVLNLIKKEGSELTMILGDTSYNKDMEGHWNSMVTTTLGTSDPALVVAGNHDYEQSDYQKILNYGKERLKNANNVKCKGAYGEKMTCQYKNLYFVLSSIGTNGSHQQHEDFIKESLETAPIDYWRICIWHKNQQDMQVGRKSNAVGWVAYETCRKKGAFIATGHEHSYSRTHLLSNMQEKRIANDTSTFTVDEGKTFAFVSGLGGKGIRDQELSGPWWAKIYTSTQDANYGALFGTFYDDYAEFYFKNINGIIIDQFTVHRGY